MTCEMAHAKVSSCVLSILSSFAGGLDVSRKLRDRRRKKRRSKADQQHADEEARLSRSLRRGPEDIVREYEKSLHSAGDGFAVGDAIAQTSLAGILLRLNTGLAGIIASFLDHDKKDARLDYPSLTDLSERSRVDTCRALRQLYKRMSQVNLAPATNSRLTLPSTEQPVHRDDGLDGVKRRKPVAKQTKIRGPTIARVVIQDSSRPPKIAMVKPGERRKRSHSASGSGSTSVSKAKTQASSATTVQTLSSPPPYDVFEQPIRPTTTRSHTAPVEAAKPRHKAPAADSSDARVPDVPHTTRPNLGLQSAPAELHGSTSGLIEPRRRKPTPTYYSISSDSTKLGEIPLHKWPVPFDFDAMSLINKEAKLNGWPINPLDNGGAEGKKRFRLFRIFGKKELSV